MIANHVRKLYQAVNAECESIGVEEIIKNEEKLKKAERCIYSLIKLCDAVTARHEHAKEPEKVDKYMRYQTLQQVRIHIITYLFY